MFERFPHRVPQHEFFGPSFLHAPLPLVFLGLMVGLVVWLVLSNRRHHAVPQGTPQIAGPGTDPAIREARMRYARGELTRDQFLAIASDLGDGSPPATP